MRIGIIGAGAVATALAGKWSAAGHQVRLGVRDTDSSKAEAARTAFGEAAITDLKLATRRADVVVVAIPGAAVPEVVRDLSDELDGKVIIDASNNVQAPVRNSVQAIVAAAPEASVFRAFNSLPAATMADPLLGDVRADLFFAGPDDGHRAVVETLIRDAGMNPIYVGSADWAPVVDALGGLSFALGRSRPGKRLAFNLVTA
jgi:predicted dinucleotide-binding enzyme